MIAGLSVPAVAAASGAVAGDVTPAAADPDTTVTVSPAGARVTFAGGWIELPPGAVTQPATRAPWTPARGPEVSRSARTSARTSRPA
ncbi:hypothetical protein [Nonomuraea solani]|uniref:hypothetical protein n=1 Tax=Nonomuraea solani TaxID=1144553 RepID=UPI0011B04FE1|nr:hypothetical protein [Nonomuraea solani]